MRTENDARRVKLERSDEKGAHRVLRLELAELLLFPWEMMRKLGVLKSLIPADVAYTFISHQWNDPEHPFSDMRQILDHWNP